MSYGVDFVEIRDNAVFRIGQHGENHLHTDGMVRNALYLNYRGLSGRLMSYFTVRQRDFFEITLRLKRIILLAAHIKKLVLYGRTSTIYNKYFHIGRKFNKKSRTLAQN